MFLEADRARLLDWSLQVLRVLKRRSDQTLFRAYGILDSFLLKTSDLGEYYEPLDLKGLHLYGLVSCFIASKLEEIQPIRMESVLFEAGHGKFQHHEIVEAERKIYQVLEYKILTETLIDRVFSLLEQAVSQGLLKNLEPSQRKELDSLLSFVSKALLHDFKLCILPLQDQALIVLVTALTHHA